MEYLTWDAILEKAENFARVIGFYPVHRKTVYCETRGKLNGLRTCKNCESLQGCRLSSNIAQRVLKYYGFSKAFITQNHKTLASSTFAADFDRIAFTALENEKRAQIAQKGKMTGTEELYR
jgi:hypothetical protein